MFFFTLKLEVNFKLNLKLNAGFELTIFCFQRAKFNKRLVVRSTTSNFKLSDSN